MRYVLIALILVMVGMYFVDLTNPYPTSLPAPTAEEQRGFNLRGLRNLTARGNVDAVARLNSCPEFRRESASGTDIVQQSVAYTASRTRTISNLTVSDLDL